MMQAMETSLGTGWPLSFDQPVHALQGSGCHICCCVSGGSGSWQGHAEASSAIEMSGAC